MDCEFTLKFRLAPEDANLDELAERLGVAGCDDALVGMGQPGHLSPEFVREARSAEDAILTALADVKKAIASARLVEVGPDLVGLTDVADLVGVTRQNMRKRHADACRFLPGSDSLRLHIHLASRPGAPVSWRARA